MPATFVVVPQWQGSGSARAMRLVDGAEAIRGDLPANATRVVDVPLEAGDEQETGIARFASLRIVHDRLLAALEGIDDWALTIGGDCSVELGAIGHVLASPGADVAVLWFDAHPDLNTPESSPSGAFTGMVLRALTGEGAAGLLPAIPLHPARIVLVGARSEDDGEAEYIAARGIQTVSAERLDTADALLAAIAATGATSVYLHVDLDVLDPADIGGIGQPVPFGVGADQLIAAIRAITEAYPIVGAGITEFSPATPEAAADDLPTILRIIAALTA